MRPEDTPQYRAALRQIKSQMQSNGSATVSNELFLCIVGAHEIGRVKVSNPDNTVLISITEPGGESIPAEIKQNYHDTCEVKFWDTTQPIGPYDIIGVDIATQIKDFIVKYKDKRFAIHCKAGISRSAAVACAVECIVLFDGDWYQYATWTSPVKTHWRYMPNKTVFDVIMSTFKHGN